MMSCDVAMLYAKKLYFKTQSVKKCALDFLWIQIFILKHCYNMLRQTSVV